MRSHTITTWGQTLTRCRRRMLLVGLACLVSLGLSLVSPTSLAQEASAPPAPTETPAETAAVTLGGETLFTLQAVQASDSVADRAALVSARLTAVANDQSIPTEAIALSETELGTAIYAKDHLIMVVDDSDVAGTDLTPQALARQYQEIIQRQISIYRNQRSAEYLSRAALIAFFCTLGLVLAILVLANVMPQFYRWLDRQQDRWVPNVRIQHFQLITAQQLTGMVRGVTSVLHFALVTALILIYFSYVLSLFPQTHTLGASIFSYLSGAVKIVVDGFIAYLPNLLSIIIALAIATAVTRFARWFFTNIQREGRVLQGFYPEWAMPTYRLVQFLVIAFTIAVVFPFLPGADSPAFQGVSIFFGLLVSLGAGGAIFSVVAGFILVYTRAFREGDRISAGNIEGFIIQKSLLVTRLRTLENVLVSIPNATLLNSNITNYSALIREEQIPIVITTTLTLGYDVPWQLIYDTLIAAADATSYVLQDPRPHVWQTSLDDFYVSYQLRAAITRPELL